MVNPLFKEWGTKKYRYKIAWGGRGSSKSWSIAEMLIQLARMAPLRFLCTRELQMSISDSVIQLLSDTIDRLGCNQEFDVQRTTIINRNTNATFLFYGLKTNVTKIKSLEGVDIVWCEEAENISEDSWNVLIPTIRKQGSQIWVSFNPANILDYTYQRFIINPPKDCLSLQVNYKDNPYFPETLRLEMEELKESNYDLYMHIWEGNPVADAENAFIKPAWILASIDSHKTLEVYNNNFGRKIIGFDVADEGGDTNAITFMHGSIIHYSDEWLDGDTGDSTRRVYNKAKLEMCGVVYDSIGVGAGAKSESNRINNTEGNKPIRFTPFNAGSSVPYPDAEAQAGTGITNKDFFCNAKAYYWWQLRMRFYNTYLAVTKSKEYPLEQLISLSSENKHIEKLTAELSRCKIDYDNNGRVKVESKKDLAKRGVKSPNLSDSLVMCMVPEKELVYVG